MVKLTYHAIQRAQERCGIPKRNLQKVADVAYKKGIRHREAEGALKKFIDCLYLSHKNANDIRIKENNAYLFNRNKVLITIINLPENLRNG